MNERGQEIHGNSQRKKTDGRKGKTRESIQRYPPLPPDSPRNSNMMLQTYMDNFSVLEAAKQLGRRGIP